jgi:hypothetical protein
MRGAVGVAQSGHLGDEYRMGDGTAGGINRANQIWFEKDGSSLDAKGRETAKRLDGGLDGTPESVAILIVRMRSHTDGDLTHAFAVPLKFAKTQVGGKSGSA